MKTITFTITDALLSPISLSILAGADIAETAETEYFNVHLADFAVVDEATTGTFTVDLSSIIGASDIINIEAPMFVTATDGQGSLEGTVYKVSSIDQKTSVVTITGDTNPKKGDTVFVDFYVSKTGDKTHELQITPDTFGGTFYVEAETLYRRESDSTDLPAIITIPKAKIQSNFTIEMSATGDPSKLMCLAA